MEDDLVNAVKAGIADARDIPNQHTLLHEAAAEAVHLLNDTERFDPSTDFSDEELARRTDALEALATPLVRAAIWGGYYGHRTTRALWPDLVARLANTANRERRAGHDVWTLLPLYPSVLVFYAVGIGAIAGDRPDLLGPLFSRATIFERAELVPVAHALYSSEPFLNDLARRLPGLARSGTAESERVHGALLPIVVGEIAATDREFSHLFDRFEYVLSLTRWDLSRGDRDRGWAPVGRFAWRREDGVRVLDLVDAEIRSMGGNWPLLP